MCEALLIHTHEMTMPDYEVEWEKIQRKEALESAVVEIMSLDERLGAYRKTKRETQKRGSLLSRIPMLNIFFKAPETPADDVSEIVDDIAQIKAETDEEESAEEARNAAENAVGNGDGKADPDAAEQPEQPDSEQSTQSDERSDQDGDSRKDD